MPEFKDFGAENDADFDQWMDDVITLCPMCKSDWVLVTGQIFNGDKVVGEAFHCDSCGHHFDDKGNSLEN